MGGWGGSHVPHTTDLLRTLPSQGWVDGVGHMYHTQQTCLELFPHRDGWMGWVTCTTHTTDLLRTLPSGMGGWGGSHVPHTTDLLRTLPSQGWVDGVGHMYHTQQTCLELFPHRDGWRGWVTCTTHNRLA